MLEQKIINQACNLIIYGAKGDLARRKLIPALYRLEKIGAIHPNTLILGVGRAEWTISMYIQIVRSSLEMFMKEPIHDVFWNRFIGKFDFCNLDVSCIDQFSKLLNKIKFLNLPTIHYFALPSKTFGSICKGLSIIGLNTKLNRIVLEKPLGTNLISAKIINTQIAKYFNENQIYRVDHYLGKETVLNLLALRFANSLFFSNWNNNTIDHVQITVAEEVGIEGRWGYFDEIGQMKDMIQSHLLQILTIIAMSPPSNFVADYIRDEKVKILQSLRMVNSKDINKISVRGQYTSGIINGKLVPGYLEEKGANKNSKTETFVSIRVDIDNWKWFGVPFYLRTGKRLSSKYSEIVIYFKKPILNLFSNSYKNLPNNKLIIRLQPNAGMNIQILNKSPELGNKYDLKITDFNFNFFDTCSQECVVSEYERLLLEVINGIQVLFVRRDEIEGSWKWVDSITKAWELENSMPKSYAAGTSGPQESIEMLLKDNRSWNEYVIF